jgi:hypothetical protein
MRYSHWACVVIMLLAYGCGSNSETDSSSGREKKSRRDRTTPETSDDESDDNEITSRYRRRRPRRRHRYSYSDSDESTSSSSESESRKVKPSWKPVSTRNTEGTSPSSRPSENKITSSTTESEVTQTTTGLSLPGTESVSITVAYTSVTPEGSELGTQSSEPSPPCNIPPPPPLMPLFLKPEDPPTISPRVMHTLSSQDSDSPARPPSQAPGLGYQIQSDQLINMRRNLRKSNAPQNP